MACGRSSNIRTLIAVAETVSSCQASWCCSGRSLLRALLHPADSAPCFACWAVLRAALDRKDATASLVITTFSHLRLVGAHHCCLLNLALASAGCAARTVGDGTLFARAFCSKRQDFRLGPLRENLSRRTTTSCLSLHLIVSTHGQSIRRNCSGSRHSKPHSAGRVGN